MKTLKIFDSSDNYIYTIDCAPASVERVAHSLNWFFASQKLSYVAKVVIESRLN